MKATNRKTMTSSKDKKISHSKVPYSRRPEDMTLEQWQVALRKQFALEQNFDVENIGNHPVFSDFNVHNNKSNRTYKVAIRDERKGLNFCSCPDFKVSALGTCKHIEYLLYQLQGKNRITNILKKDMPPNIHLLSLRYGHERKMILRIGSNNSIAIKAIAKDYFDENNFLKDTMF